MQNTSFEIFFDSSCINSTNWGLLCHVKASKWFYFLSSRKNHFNTMNSSRNVTRSFFPLHLIAEIPKNFSLFFFSIHFWFCIKFHVLGLIDFFSSFWWVWMTCKIRFLLYGPQLLYSNTVGDQSRNCNLNN